MTASSGWWKPNITLTSALLNDIVISWVDSNINKSGTAGSLAYMFKCRRGLLLPRYYKEFNRSQIITWGVNIMDYNKSLLIR